MLIADAEVSKLLNINQSDLHLTSELLLNVLLDKCAPGRPFHWLDTAGQPDDADDDVCVCGTNFSFC